MNRSLYVTGSAAWAIKRRFLKCDGVPYTSPFCSNFEKVLTDHLTEDQLCHSVTSGIDIYTRRDGIDQDGQVSREFSCQNPPFSDYCPADAKNLNPDAALERLETRESIDNVLKINRKNGLSGKLARRRILSSSANGVIVSSITQGLVKSSLSPSLGKQWASTRSFSVSALVRPSGWILMMNSNLIRLLLF